MFGGNIIINTDGYKLSHEGMYPPGTRRIFSYIESRGRSPAFDFTEDESIVHFGTAAIRYFLQSGEWLIDEFKILEAEHILSKYGVEVNGDRWRRLLDKHNGDLPVQIRALPDGTVIKPHTPQLTIYNYDPTAFWLTSYLETALLRTVWYASTVATLSRDCKKIIASAMEISCDNLDGLPFKLHDFGSRGASSEEAATIGGLAHLVNFMGTDTLSALHGADMFYADEAQYVTGVSIPASEHSTIIAWGREREVDAYRHILQQYGKPGALFSCVSDSYDLDYAVENIWGGILRDEVIASGSTPVIRPDSGDPVKVVVGTLQRLDAAFGHTLNSKGYRVLNNVRIIQGDGITPVSIHKIMETMMLCGYSIDNIAFGMGGGLLQSVNRDSLRYAMKASAVEDEWGVWHEISKDPATDHSKKSKAGLIRLNGRHETEIVSTLEEIDEANELLSVYDPRLGEDPFGEWDMLENVRKRAAL